MLLQVKTRDLMQCGICIVDETPDSILLSVRIEKETIRKHLHLIAAVSDIVAPNASCELIDRLAVIPPLPKKQHNGALVKAAKVAAVIATTAAFIGLSSTLTFERAGADIKSARHTTAHH